MNHKTVDSAKKGQEICVKIEPIPGESPKMYGRHFEAVDIIVSKVCFLPASWNKATGAHRMPSFVFVEICWEKNPKTNVEAYI